MKGIEECVNAVVDRVDARMPDKVTQLRERYGIEDASDLPIPSAAAAYDRAAIPVEDWPAIMIVPGRTVRMRRVDTDGIEETWEVRYRLRAFVWARGDAAKETALTRYRLTLGLREVLATSRKFGQHRIDSETLVESFSDVAVDEDAGATIAAAYLEFEIDVEETLTTGQQSAVVHSARADTRLVPPHADV